MAKFAFAVVALVAVLGVAEARTLQSSGELVTTEGKVVMQKAGEESLECQGCKVFVTAGEKYLEEKAPIIKAGAEKECAKLGEHAAVCDEIVDAGIAAVLEYATTVLTPDGVCTKVGACAAPPAAELPQKVREIVEARSNNDAAAPTKECSECKFAIETAHAALADNATIAKIIAEADVLCAKLPASFSSECASLVAAYAPMAIGIVNEQLADSEAVCEKFGMCVAPAAEAKVDAPDAMGCFECQMLVEAGEKYLEDNATTTKILAEAQKLCALAGDKAPVCLMAAQAILEYTIEYVDANYPPKTVCTMIGACAKAEGEVAAQGVTDGMRAAIVQGAGVAAPTKECMECKFAVESAHAALEDNATVTKILAKAEELCGKIPASAAGECEALVAAYGPMVVNYLDCYTADSEGVCEKVGMCAKPSSSTSSSEDKPAPASIVEMISAFEINPNVATA